nr:PREDICTED: uncharacterized protein LOC108208330 isoform X1 [Daucus carota subsp. sativus]
MRMQRVMKFPAWIRRQLHSSTYNQFFLMGCPTSKVFSMALIELNQLEDLVVCNCKLVEGIVADTRDSEPSDTNDKIITLPKLSLVKLHKLPNLKSFIHGANYELHMPALVDMRVVNCGLSTLFTCSVLQKLKQLKELSVDSCRVLEGIVADTKGIEASGTKDKIIMLPKLSSVKLEKLPNLKSFIRGANYELHVPAVVHVGVINCGLSTLFTCSVLRKLKLLEGLFVDSCELLEGIVADTRGMEASDTSDKIITLPKLSSDHLDKLPNLRSFIHGVNYELHMPALEGMIVANCVLTTLFPCSVFQTLQQLKWSVVYECRLLESIGGDARVINTSDTKIFKLP